MKMQKRECDRRKCVCQHRAEEHHSFAVNYSNGLYLGYGRCRCCDCSQFRPVPGQPKKASRP